MNALRLKITLLVMGAIVAMSVIGIAAAASVSFLAQDSDSPRVIFRYSPGSSEQATQSAPAAKSFLAKFVPDPYGVPLALVVAGYALLIVAGSGSVGLIVANMVVRPLAVLEEAVNSVDAEGFIPRLDEKGLGEGLEVAKLINRLSERLKAAMESRMRLVAAAGHDLRTPMTRMRLRVEFMESEEDRVKWSRDIDEMLHIADSAIRLVREEAGVQSTERIGLAVLVENLCAELREIGHGVRTESLEAVDVRGGQHSVKRAVSNLIVNAATHGGEAAVTLRRDGQEAVIEIADAGPGIPEAMLGRAFEPFFRASPARHKAVPGAGLGLAIAKEIITRHGGTVTLSNRLTGGLLQTVRLPLAA